MSRETELEPGALLVRVEVARAAAFDATWALATSRLSNE